MVPDWTKEYIGIPFKEKGRDLDNGVDCWGLVRVVWQKEYNIDVPSYTTEYDDISRRDMIETAIWDGIDDEWEEVDDPVEGDGIVLQLMGKPVHIGVVLDDRKFLHIFKGINSVIADYTGMRWNQRIEGFYRHESVINNA